MCKKKKIEISESNVKFGKRQTIINFNGLGNGNIENTKRLLQRVCACGGKCEEDTVMLQGWHAPKAKDTLLELGFDENQIDIKPRLGM